MTFSMGPRAAAILVALILLVITSNAASIPADTAKEANKIEIPHTSARLSILSEDTTQINKFLSYSGTYLEYFAPIDDTVAVRDWQAEGVHAELTKAVISAGIGSHAYTGSTPPGWSDIIANNGTPNRGHLLAGSLAGTGRDARNIVAMYRNTNHPVMYRWENKVRQILLTQATSTDSVLYFVYANYDSTHAHPISITISTYFSDASQGTSSALFRVHIPNRYNVVYADVTIDYDHTTILFPNLR